MSNPWVLVVVGLAWAASLFAVGAWQRDDATAICNAGWLKTATEEQRQYDAALAKANDRNLNNERYWVAKMNEVAAQLFKGENDARIQHQRDLAALRAGELRLRDAGARPSSGGCTSPAAGTSAAGGDAAAGCELSVAASGFLLGLADEADSVVRQLHACQAVTANDRTVK